MDLDDDDGGIAINQGVHVNRMNVIAEAFSSRRPRLSILLSSVKDSPISSVSRARLMTIKVDRARHRLLAKGYLPTADLS